MTESTKIITDALNSIMNRELGEVPFRYDAGINGNRDWGIDFHINVRVPFHGPSGSLSVSMSASKDTAFGEEQNPDLPLSHQHSYKLESGLLELRRIWTISRMNISWGSTTKDTQTAFAALALYQKIANAAVQIETMFGDGIKQHYWIEPDTDERIWTSDKSNAYGRRKYQEELEKRSPLHG